MGNDGKINLSLVQPAPPPGGPVPAKVEFPGGFQFASNFGDAETLFNSRAWLEAALSARGASIVGGGIGCGQADLSIMLDGFPFTVSIRPVIRG